MNEHLTHWSAMARPPKTALKEIRGGRLQGMTDVNPQWRYQAMTEQFGPCGDGWKYTIDRLWTEPGTDGEVLAFAQVSVLFRVPDHGEWSDPIVGIGGNHMIAKEKNGLRGNDECWKMAVTDALSVALKMLGVAADVYAGLWDGSKYVDHAAETERDKATVKPDAATKKARAPLPEDSGAVYIEKVIPKSRGNQEWAELVLSSGESVVARNHQAIALAVEIAQDGTAVVISTHQNGKGNTELDQIERWPLRPGPAPVMQLTAADVGF